MTSEIRACPACLSDQAHKLSAYAPEEWDLVQCASCQFVYLTNPPPYSALEEDFAWKKTYAEKQKWGGSTRLSGLNRSPRSRFGLRGGKRSDRMFSVWFGAGKALDIGCGDRIRTQTPITPYGIELSTALQARSDEQMRARGGYCLHASGADGVWQFDPGFFDSVILHCYLEHESDPMRVFQGIHNALKPGGKVFVRVPNYGSLNRRVIGAKWCGCRHPDHVNYFTLSSLRAIAGKAGFSTQVVNRATLIVDDNIQALLHRLS
jgi:SAM-dependent methyltransferase